MVLMQPIFKYMLPGFPCPKGTSGFDDRRRQPFGAVHLSSGIELQFALN
jgi:hypothetical protein